MNKRVLLPLAAFSAVCILLISSCDKKVGKMPLAAPPTIVGSACDSTSYANDIKAIVDTKCAISGCHDAGTQSGGVTLTSYSSVKNQADLGRIKARVIDKTPSVMPPTGELPQNEKDKINCWLGNGKKE